MPKPLTEFQKSIYRNRAQKKRTQECYICKKRAHDLIPVADGTYICALCHSLTTKRR
jgi:hypothetical protein